MELRSTSPLAFVFVSMLAACGGGSTPPADTGTGSDATDLGAETGGVSQMQACTDLATARCARLDACTNMIGVARDFPSMADCISRYTTTCMSSYMVPATTTTAAGVEGCAMALMAQSCSDWRQAVPLTACIAPAGSVANTMPCVNDSECASTICLVPSNAQCGTCADQPMDGASCSGGTTCGRGLVCHYPSASATTGTCRVPVAANGMCDSAHPCIGGYACVTAAADAGSMGTCQALGTAVGTACNFRSIGMPSCDPVLGLFCNNMNQCAMATAAASGAACGVMSSGASSAYCTGGATCYPFSGSSRTCTGPAMDGMACDTSMGMDCEAPAKCVGTYVDGGMMGTCQLFNPNAC